MLNLVIEMEHDILTLLYFYNSILIPLNIIFILKWFYIFLLVKNNNRKEINVKWYFFLKKYRESLTKLFIKIFTDNKLLQVIYRL